MRETPLPPGSPSRNEGPETPEDTSIEKVEGAVIRFKGKNFLAANSNHTKAREMIEAEYGQVDEKNFEAYGFLTSKGRIVQESEAFNLMVASGQIPQEDISEQEIPVSERLKIAKEYPEEN